MMRNMKRAVLLVLLLATAGAAQTPVPVEKQVAAADEYLSRLVVDAAIPPRGTPRSCPRCYSRDL